MLILTWIMVWLDSDYELLGFGRGEVARLQGEVEGQAGLRDILGERLGLGGP